jgi:hypothetical protein
MTDISLTTGPSIGYANTERKPVKVRIEPMTGIFILLFFPNTGDIREKMGELLSYLHAATTR